MALPKINLPDLNKIVEESNNKVEDEKIPNFEDIDELIEGQAVMKDGVEYLVHQGKLRRRGKGSRVLIPIAPTTYAGASKPPKGVDIAPDLAIPDLDDKNLHKELDKYFD